MFYRIVKPVIIGVLLGIALFILPFFIINVLLFFVIGSLIFRVFMWRRFKRWGYTQYSFRPYKSRPQGPVINIEVK